VFKTVALQTKLLLFILQLGGLFAWEVIKIYWVFCFAILVATSLVTTQKVRLNTHDQRLDNLQKQLQVWKQVESLQPNSEAINKHLESLESINF